VRRSAAAFLGCAALAFSGCRTLPAPSIWQALAVDDPRAVACLAALTATTETRHALRASARVRSEGPEGAVSTNQLLLVASPARLRVEVLGLLQQRALVLATDGERYELYRAEQRSTEEGAVHPAVLEEVAGLPLTPEAAVALLLAAPRPPAAAADSAALDAAGALRLGWPEQTLECDAEGRLQALSVHPGAHVVLHARWSDWRAAAGGWFPHRLELALPETASHWAIEFRQLEVDPELDPALFRLGLGSR
jgi:hypothetical protein